MSYKSETSTDYTINDPTNIRYTRIRFIKEKDITQNLQ